MREGQNTYSSSYEQIINNWITWNACLLSRYSRIICVLLSHPPGRCRGHAWWCRCSPRSVCTLGCRRCTWMWEWTADLCSHPEQKKKKKTPKSSKSKHTESCPQFNATGAQQQAVAVVLSRHLIYLHQPNSYRETWPVYESSIQSTAAILLGLLSFLLQYISQVQYRFFFPSTI